MSTSDDYKIWIEPMNILLKNKTAKVLCPVCHKGFLDINDYFEPGPEPTHFERVMTCHVCGKGATSLHRIK